MDETKVRTECAQSENQEESHDMEWCIISASLARATGWGLIDRARGLSCNASLKFGSQEGFRDVRDGGESALEVWKQMLV